MERHLIGTLLVVSLMIAAVAAPGTGAAAIPAGVVEAIGNDTTSTGICSQPSRPSLMHVEVYDDGSASLRWLGDCTDYAQFGSGACQMTPTLLECMQSGSRYKAVLWVCPVCDSIPNVEYTASHYSQSRGWTVGHHFEGVGLLATA